MTHVGLRSLGLDALGADPDRYADQQADTDEPAAQTLGDRAEPAERRSHPGSAGPAVTSTYAMMSRLSSRRHAPGRRRPACSAGRSASPRRCASALTPISVGAYLPFGSAPPWPAKLWHGAQLVRNSSPPWAICSSVALLTSYDSSRRDRRAGGERGDVRGQRLDLRLGVRRRLARDLRARLRRAASGRCRPGSRPRPRRRRSATGRILPRRVPPSAFRPWQLAQPTAKSFLPSSICWDWARVVRDRVVRRRRRRTAEPTATRPNRSTTSAGDRCRRRAEHGSAPVIK